MSEPGTREVEPELPADEASDIQFLDVSAKPGLEQLHRSPTLERELADAGFLRVGWMQCRSIGGGNPYRGRDAAEHDRRRKRERHSREPVYLSADGLTMAFAEIAHGADWLEMLSLLESGAVVRTHMRPSRLPELAFADDANDAELTPGQRMVARWKARAFGDPFRIANRDRRGSGWRVQICERLDVPGVLDAHRRFLAKLSRRTAPVPLDMALGLACRRRCRHVSRVQGRILAVARLGITTVPALLATTLAAAVALVAGAPAPAVPLLAFAILSTVAGYAILDGVLPSLHRVLDAAVALAGLAGLGLGERFAGGTYDVPWLSGGLLIGAVLAHVLLVLGEPLVFHIENVLLALLPVPRAVPASLVRAAYPEPRAAGRTVKGEPGA